MEEVKSRLLQSKGWFTLSWLLNPDNFKKCMKALIVTLQTGTVEKENPFHAEGKVANDMWEKT